MIRKAVESDIPELSKLLKQVQQIHYEGRPDIFKCGAQKYTESELVERISNENTPIFVSVVDEAVSGYAFCAINQTIGNNTLKDRTTIYIDDLCVDESCRGCGIGRSLFEYVVSYAKERGYDGITLNVWQFNKSAMEFYNKLGMTPLKTIMEYNI